MPEVDDHVLGDVEWVDPGQLVAHSVNWRRHDRAQKDAFRTALERHGWIKALVCSRRSGRILNGHMRHEVALEDGLALVPVRWVRCRDERHEDEVLATFDGVGSLAARRRTNLRRLTEDAGSAWDVSACGAFP